MRLGARHEPLLVANEDARQRGGLEKVPRHDVHKRGGQPQPSTRVGRERVAKLCWPLPADVVRNSGVHNDQANSHCDEASDDGRPVHNTGLF